MAKRESIWKANDGSEHRSKQGAAVADAENDIRQWVIGESFPTDEAFPRATAASIITSAGNVEEMLATLRRARAALVKHEGKAE